MGNTLYDQLVMWDLSRADVASVLMPGLATTWTPDPSNPKRWTFALRPGVKFHDGKTMVADDIVFSFNRAFKKDDPAFDARANGQVGLRLPTIATWGATDDHTFWLETSIVDSTVPYGVTWVGHHPSRRMGAAGRNWDTYLGKGRRHRAVEAADLRHPRAGGADAQRRVLEPGARAEKRRTDPAADAGCQHARGRAAHGPGQLHRGPAAGRCRLAEGGPFRHHHHAYPHNWTWHLSKIAGSPWQDIRVRKAVNLAVDRAGLKTLLNGLDAGRRRPGAAQPSLGTARRASNSPTTPTRRGGLLAAAGFTPAKPLKTKIAISNSGSGQMQPLPMNEFIQENLKDVGILVDFECSTGMR